MFQDVRVRFAPSPTGPLHIGGLRTALFNYLFARHVQGTCILRIEDTDQQRYVEGAEKYIQDSLAWLGLSPDEGPVKGGAYGPYRQSERTERYRSEVQTLIDNGHAYYAFDTAEEIEAMRKEKEAAGDPYVKYDYRTRNEMNNSIARGMDASLALIEAGTPYVIRLKVEPKKTIAFHDIVRGDVQFDSSELDDKVLLKSDGFPTYHLANVVDDYSMKISHVIRGEEWLSSTAHHVLLYHAFGWEDQMPTFAHLPLILKPSGKGKLSKRDADKSGIPVFPLPWQDGEDTYISFQGKGVLPSASMNFLALLGWNPGDDREFFNVEELIATFSLEKVHKAGARFDFDKLKWFNQHYIMQMSSTDLLPYLDARLPDDKKAYAKDFKLQYIDLFKDRIELLEDFYSIGAYCFEDTFEYDTKALKKRWKDNSSNILIGLEDSLAAVENWTTEDIKTAVDTYIQKNELSYGQVLPLFRIGITGILGGPDIFAVSALIDCSQTLSRLQRLRQHQEV